ncbi:MAG: hypothetical protein ACI4TH_03235 [Candidatus Ornithomonoglobus sp.]
MIQLILIILAVLVGIWLIGLIIEIAGAVFGIAVLIGLVIFSIHFYYITIPILVIYCIYKILQFCNKRRKAKRWYRKKLNPITDEEIDDMFIQKLSTLSDKNTNERIFNIYNLPYGRVNAFMNYFKKSVYDDEPYYYSAIPSRDDNELREYGVVIARSGIYFATQNVSHDKKRGKPAPKKLCYLQWSGMWNTSIEKVDKKMKKLHIDYYDMSYKELLDEKTTIPLDALKEICDFAISSGITNRITRGKVISVEEIERTAEEQELNIRLQNNVKIAEKAAVSSAAVGMMKSNKSDVLVKDYSSRMRGTQGHGFAAEYANNVISDLNPLKVICNSGADNAANGADRTEKNIVTQKVVKIQSKFYANGRDAVNAAFKDGVPRYIEDGKMMKIEVPYDTYADAKLAMEQHIKDGQIPGCSDPKEASKYLKRSPITYNCAVKIAQAGTIEGIAFDVLGGVVCSLPAASIGGLITFAIARWNNVDAKTAFGMSLKTAGISMLPMVTKFVVEMQLNRLIDTNLSAVDKNILETRNKAKAHTAGTIISMSITFGPDICRFVSGKISMTQLIKNSIVAGTGIAGSSVGYALGEVILPIPIVGGLVGGAVVGAAGGFLAKKVVDTFAEDDALKMLRILKEEFIDVISLAGLNQDEISEVVSETIGSQNLGRLLKEMYASQEYRAFARDAIVGAAVINVLSKRNVITNDEYEQALLAAAVE